MKPSPKHKGHDGFTLIEILIGTAILGIMMLILTGSLRIGAQSWEAGEARIERANRQFVIQNFLKRHIATLLPLSAVNAKGEMEPALNGINNAFSYIAALPDQLEGGGLYRFIVYLTGDEGNQAVRVSITPFQSNPKSERPPPQPIDDVVLLDQASHFQVSYFGISQEQNTQTTGGPPQPRWTNTWHDYQLPLMIRIDMGRIGEPSWPTLLIAPKTQVLR